MKQRIAIISGVVVVLLATVLIVATRPPERVEPSAVRPVSRPSAAHLPTSTGSAEEGELVTRAQLAARLNRRVAEPDESLKEQLLPVAQKLMTYYATATYDEYQQFRRAAGLPDLPDDQFRGNYDLVAPEMQKLKFRWDESVFMVVRRGPNSDMLIHDGMASSDLTRPGGMSAEVASVPVPFDSYRVVCRVPVDFPEPCDGVTSGTYYIFMSNSLPTGEWVVFKRGIASSGNHAEAWRKYVGGVF